MSDIIPILKEPYCEIYFEEANNILYAKWIGLLKVEEVKKGCRVMTEFIRQNKVRVHLSDHRELRILMMDVQAYLTGEWFHEVEDLGLQKIGVIVSEDIFAKMTVDDVNALHVGRLAIQTYNWEDDCRNWLMEG